MKYRLDVKPVLHPSLRTSLDFEHAMRANRETLFAVDMYSQLAAGKRTHAGVVLFGLEMQHLTGLDSINTELNVFSNLDRVVGGEV